MQAGNAAVGGADDPRLGGFRAALDGVLLDLAIQVVTRRRGRAEADRGPVAVPASDASARRIGLAIANSPLVKTAIAGGDANWGRVVMAVGKSGEPTDMARLGVAFGGHAVARDGAAVADLDEAPVAAHLRRPRDRRSTSSSATAPGAATVWTCDLTHGYIDINADYRS